MAALISDSVAFSCTPAEAVKPLTINTHVCVYCMVCLFTPQA